MKRRRRTTRRPTRAARPRPGKATEQMMAATALATTRVSVELPNGRVITLDAESLVQLAAVVSGATTMSEVAATVRQVLGEGAEALSVTQCLTAAVGMIEEGERLKALITSMEAKQHGSA